MPATLNLGPFHRGDTIPLKLTFTDGVVPIDMRGKTIYLTLKVSSAQADTSAALSKSVTPLAGDTLAQAGEVTITIEHSESLPLITDHPYSYSIRVSEPASPEAKETTYIVGTFTLVDA
jgi:hypothetical protein